MAVDEDDAEVLGEVVLEDQGLEGLLDEVGSAFFLELLGRVVEGLDFIEDSVAVDIHLGREKLHLVDLDLYSTQVERRDRSLKIGEGRGNGGKV